MAEEAPNLFAKRLHLDLPPKEIFARLVAECENAFLLESAKGKSRLAEFSFLGFDPSAIVKAKDGVLEFDDLARGSVEETKTSDPFDDLKRLVPPETVSGLFRFVGGAVGYISYDAVRYFERLPRNAIDDTGLPDFQFGIYTDGVVFDHGRQEYYYYSLRKDRSADLLRIASKGKEVSGTSASEHNCAVGRESFEDKVRKTKEYIEEGEVFQTVISKRYDLDVEGDLCDFYTALSEINPSPYMYFVKFGKRRIVGSSPEMLVRVEDGRVETYPIAGTRPRVSDDHANAILSGELLADPKEMAEHVMLVDLARNDVGKVSNYGTVKVPEFASVEQFSHVQHIVSHVTGELKESCSSYDALRAVFPAGTVSGAPKVRAMQVIEELEPFRRGPYAGALGYFSFNGNADFAITIRTLVSEGRKCSVQSGAGIVADSSPENEWMETERKARVLFNALEISEKRSK